MTTDPHDQASRSRGEERRGLRNRWRKIDGEGEEGRILSVQGGGLGRMGGETGGERGAQEMNGAEREREVEGVDLRG